jgi:hypothetical protein
MKLHVHQSGRDTEEYFIYTIDLTKKIGKIWLHDKAIRARSKDEAILKYIMIYGV